MRVTGFDERHLVRETIGANFVVFIYEGRPQYGSSWSVDSRLLTDTDVPEVLGWLKENLPTDSCWSLGIVLNPAQPTPDSDLTVAWVVGADVLNMGEWEPQHRRLAEEMLARRHRVEMP
jgi:hypothetical protein